jgi:UDP-N-acetylglucosamine 2-epimerase (non-hydrolysing)
MAMRILTVFGTRPEAIKMAPLVRALGSIPQFESKVCITAQHREMLDQVLNLFKIKPDFDLNIMQEEQTLIHIASNVIKGVGHVIKNFSPDLILVHGDTTTTMAAALAGFYSGIPIGHVEAGLRTKNIFSPWPEEANRKITDAITSLYFAPTATACGNLLNEGVSPAQIHITGNTVIDALHLIVDGPLKDEAALKVLHERFGFLNFNKKIILVTGHRRENFGQGMRNICEALRELAELQDVEIVYPVHLNPNVQGPVYEILSGFNNINLIEPLEYLDFVFLMSKSYCILTDSGGIQEEAPFLGKPVFVMRETSERPEAVEAGIIKLVGINKNRILEEVVNVIKDVDLYDNMARTNNIYGDGKACERIINVLINYCNK